MCYPMLLCLLFPSNLPRDRCLVDTVDRVEFNHVYSPEGRLIGEYTLFWDWDQNRCDWVIVDWRKMRETGRWSECDGWYRMIWRDGNRLRMVRTRNTLETWTRFDREIEDRDRFPIELRRGLRR